MTTKQTLLDWTNLGSWRDIVLDAALNLFAPTRDRSWLSSLPSPSSLWDDSSRLIPLMEEAGINDYEVFCERLGNQLPELFTKLRAVHLCRPVDQSSYTTRGLIKMNPVELQNDFVKFMTCQHPELSEAIIRKAISEMSVEYREALIFFGIDERALLEECGHYAAYGSEYLVALAVRIGDGRTDYRQALKRRGKPCVVVAHLPFEMIDGQTLNELSDDLLQAALWSCQLNKDRSPHNHFGFDMPDDVPPNLIHEVVDASAARDPWAH